MIERLEISKQDEASIRLVLWLLSDISRYKEYMKHPIVQNWIGAYSDLITRLETAGQLGEYK